MAPKTSSTAGKPPASTASKSATRSMEGAKTERKTSKTAAPADGEKEKQKKVRKRSSVPTSTKPASRSTPTLVFPTRRWSSSTASLTITSTALLQKHSNSFPTPRSRGHSCIGNDGAVITAANPAVIRPVSESSKVPY